MLDADDIKKIFEVLDPHFTKIYNKLLEHDEKFEQIDKRFELVDKRFDQIDARLDRLEGRMDKLEARMDKLEARMDGIESRMDRLEKDVTEIKGYHKDLEKTLETIKRLFTDLMLKVGMLEDRIYDLENNPDQADFQKESAEIKQEFEALKDRVTRLEKLIDRVCEAEEKYKS